MPNSIPERPQMHILANFITKLLLVQGYDSILVVVDRLTKMVHFIPTTKKILAEGLARLFKNNVQKLYGLPKSIILDKGPQSAARLMRELNRILEIESEMSMVFHPQTNRQMERVNQELEQYLRMFIDHRQEQWPDWLGIAEFVYNNKIYSSTKMLPFKANYGQDPRIEFKARKKEKYKGVEKFVTKMKEIQKEAKAVLGKVQEEIKKYTDRKREEVDKYKVGDLVILSTKDLKYNIVGRRTEKLTKRFVGLYKVKKIISVNIVELELPSTIKIHLVVNISRIHRYVGQVEGQRKEQLAPVIIEGEKEWKVERILNKQQVRGKDKYLVQWKGFTAESDTWKGIENLENTKEVVEEFKKEYWQDIEDVRRQKRKERIFRREELPGKFTARKLFGWSDKRYNKEYWARLERNWRQWKGARAREQRTMETIKEEEEEIGQENLGLREWTEEDDNNMGNICVIRQSQRRRLFPMYFSTQQITSRSIMQERYKQHRKAYVRYIQLLVRVM